MPRTTDKNVPHVSVVVPTYNRARLLPRCIDSVHRQTYEDVELVVIDDGSTDDTEAVVRKHAPEARYFKQENQRIPAARNRGVAESRGELIKFLDSDDVLAPRAVEAEVKVMDSHSEVGLVYSAALEANENGTVVRTRGPHFAKNDYVRSGISEIRDLLFTCYITCSTVMIRRRLLIDAGSFDTELFPFSEDWDMFLRLGCLGSVAYLHEPLVTYYVHSGDTPNSYGVVEPRTFEWLRRVPIERAFSDPVVGPATRDIAGRVLARHHWTVATLAYKTGDMKYAREQLRSAFQVAPREWLGRDGVAGAMLFMKSVLPASLRTGTRPFVQRARRLVNPEMRYDATFQSRSSRSDN